ncbi:hypothetical protein VWZ88_12480 [Phaeobacter sp. JH20_36]|uniref:hypothetical protein n=1 Tax=unclassified Phaeobacter TaxID=2621772 RepID=UPI003A8765AC
MATVAKSDRSTTITLASASAGPFDLDFRLFDTDGLAVYVNDAPREDWTLSARFNDGFDDNATLTFNDALGEGSIIVIDGALTPWRQQDYLNSGQLVQKLNVELGRIWSVVSELFRNSRRSLRFFKAIDPVPLTAGKVLAINAEGTGIQLVEPRDAGVPDDELTMIKAFRTGQALLADPTESYTVGTILSPETENTRYIVAHPTEANPDIVTAGGVKAFEIGPEFSDIYKLRGAIQRGDLRDGQRVFCNGAGYTVDSTATGLDGALWRFGVDGLRHEGGELDNLFLMTAFKNQDVTAQYAFLSNDGLSLKRLNQTPITRGAGDATTGGRDSQPFWARQRRNDPWMMPVTAGEGLEYDFSIFVSSDIVTPVSVKCQLQGGNAFGGVRGTVLPGATRAVDLLWSPRLHNIGDKVYLTISLRTQDDYTDGFGNPSPTFRPFIAECLDIEALTFGPPVAMSVGTTTTAMLEPDLVQAENGTWYMCIKNSANRNIEIHSATDPINGAWSFVTTLDLDGTLNSLEGAIWVEQVYRDASTGERLLKYRVHVANNRNADDELRGVPVEFISTGGPEGPYGAAQDVNNSHSMRNGDMLNVALEPDPRAIRSLLDVASSFSGEYPAGVDECIRLPDEPHNLTPQQDSLYYVNTAGYACTLTIEKAEARRFWLASLSSDAGTYIDVENNSLCVGNTRIGGGAFQITEFLWVDFLGKYVGVQSYAVGGGGSADGVVTGVSFDSGTNVLTLTRSVGGDLTVDLSALDGGGSGLINWSESGNNLVPTTAGALGNAANPVRGLVLEPRDAAGATGAATPLELFRANNGAIRDGTVGDTASNDGADIGHYTQHLSSSATSGTVVWDRANGNGLNITGGPLTGTLTVDLSALIVTETVCVIVAEPNSQTINFTLPGGGVKWAGGAQPSSGTATLEFTFKRHGSSNTHATGVEFS